jgi:MinD-like ATPase involved in chromosome partitioning or flagellar assembly
LQQGLQLDYLSIDPRPGVNEETLLSIAISDTLVVVLRGDHQEYQDTPVTVDLARHLKTPRSLMIVNNVPPPFDPTAVAEQIGATDSVRGAGVGPQPGNTVPLASRGVLALTPSDRPVIDVLRGVAGQLR